jgi:hypothetical protein
MERINFIEIDNHKNHVIRLTGGTFEEQEIRVNKMCAAEMMYKTIADIVNNTMFESAPPSKVDFEKWREDAVYSLNFADGKSGYFADGIERKHLQR